MVISSKLFRKVNCLNCPLEEICEFSCSDVIAMDKDGFLYCINCPSNPDFPDPIDMANQNCPLKKLIEKANES